MNISCQTHITKKSPDTTNTVQISYCNKASTNPNLNGQPASALTPEILTLIDILARQAAREICSHKEGK